MSVSARPPLNHLMFDFIIIDSESLVSFIAADLKDWGI